MTTGDTLTYAQAPGQAPMLPWSEWESAPLWRAPRWELVLRLLGAVLVLAWLGFYLYGLAAAPRYVPDQRAFVGDAAAGRLLSIDGSGVHDDPHLPDRARLDALRLGIDDDPTMMRWHTKDGYYQTIDPDFDAADAVRNQPYVLANPDSVRYRWLSAGQGAVGAVPVVVGIALLAGAALANGPQSRLMPRWAWALSFASVVGLAAWLVVGGSTQWGRPVPVRHRAAWLWVAGAGVVLALFVYSTGGGPLRSVLNAPYRGGGPFVEVDGMR